MKDHVTTRIESAAFDPETVQVASFSGRETVSRLFEFEIRLVTSDPAGLDETKLLTNAAAVVFERNASESLELVEERRITGMFCKVRDRAASESDHREYVLTFVPRMWRTTLTKTSDIFMDMSVPDILKKKLEGNGLADGQDFEFRLGGSYTPAEFIVQYQESDFDFICRLAEDRGIFFFFEQKDGVDCVVFGDQNDATQPSSPVKAPFAARGDRTNVFELEATRQVVTKNFKTRDYNYRNPSMDVLGEAANETVGSAGMVDEFGAHAKTPSEASRYATLRAEEAASRHLTFEGTADLPGIRAGSKLEIEGHPRGKIELFVFEVSHEANQAAFGMGGSGAEVAYASKFRAVPKAVAYRPPRITPKPVVHGVVTGLVTPNGGADFGAVDDQGRYRVTFAYDTVADRGEAKASRWLRMAQPSAGADRGFHQPLKAGTEVVITCVNGDPDRPIIAGAVPNPQTPSPVTAANAEKSMWKTNVNAIAIDDAKPRMKMTVSGEDHVFQIGEPNAPEFGLVTGTIGNASTMVNGVSTSYSSIKTSYDDYKTSLTGNDIVNIAGVPSPWSLWKKIEAVVSGAVGFAKTVSGIAEGGQKIFTDFAKQTKKDADAALDAAKAKAAKDLALDTTPKPTTNADGTTRMETTAEARDRALKAAIEKPATPAAEAARVEVQAATEAVADAEADVAAYDKGWEEAAANVSTGTTGDVIKGIETTLGAVQAGQALFSTISKIFAKATQNASFVAMKGQQKGSTMFAKTSGQRTKADVGTFAEHYNIQGATHSLGLQGLKNTFISGGLNTTLMSGNAMALLAAKRLDMKTYGLVEIAGENVMLSAKKNVDMWASGKVMLIAHPSDKHKKAGNGYTMFFHSKEAIMMDSCDADIVAIAKKNIRCQAETESLELKAKKSVKVEAEEGDFEVKVSKGKASIKAVEANASLTSKKDLELATSNGNFLLEAAKGQGAIRAKKNLTLGSKGGEWKASGTLSLKGQSVVVNGSKIKLG